MLVLWLWWQIMSSLGAKYKPAITAPISHLKPKSQREAGGNVTQTMMGSLRG